ncbi:MAG TPA: hypothetical protein VKS03_05685, partial [Thermoanaerobaculia bacterium]|nr:hypothetical protein [Thermoanaerobaculia bacterium]
MIGLEKDPGIFAEPGEKNPTPSESPRVPMLLTEPFRELFQALGRKEFGSNRLVETGSGKKHGRGTVGRHHAKQRRPWPRPGVFTRAAGPAAS